MKLHQKGFTIIELMIATTVLATLLLLCASVAIQVGKLFYKGVSSSRTQEAARSISAQISRDIQFSGQLPIIGGNFFCVGNTRYSYNLDTQVGGGAHALWVDKDSTGNCSAAGASGTARELVPNRMSLKAFSLTQAGSDNRLWNLRVRIGLGESDLFTPAGVCVNSTEGGQFCSISELNTSIYRRLQ